jgi:hypothetical protein
MIIHINPFLEFLRLTYVVFGLPPSIISHIHTTAAEVT